MHESISHLFVCIFIPYMTSGRFRHATVGPPVRQVPCIFVSMSYVLGQTYIITTERRFSCDSVIKNAVLISSIRHVSPVDAIYGIIREMAGQVSSVK